jgi:DNA ligase (NAD+)
MFVHCTAKVLGRFAHFVSRNAMNIEGLSEATLEKFIDAGFLKTFDDIYRLENHRTEIIKMEGFGLKSYNKLIEAIEKSRDVKMENFLYALGIQHIGRSASKIVSKYFKGDWFEFEEALIHNFDFTKLEDFGEAMHESINKWYNSTYERKLWTGCTYVLKFIQEQKTSTSSDFKDLTGLTFVITGGVTTFKNRDEVKELVDSLGGKMSGSVSAKTDYLISNEASGSSKSKKAQELGVKVITESDFNEMIGRCV